MSLLQASERTRAETQSAMRLTKDFVETTLARSPEAPEPAAVKALVASLQNLRHVRAGIGDPSLASSILSEANKESEAPRWFRALVSAPAETAVIPVAVKNGGMESIILVADPADEIDEVWVGARDHALVGGLMALAAIGVTSLLVGRAVRPLGVAGATLARLEAGDYSARAEGDGPPGDPQPQCEDQLSRGGARWIESRQRRTDGARFRRPRRGATAHSARVA